MANGSRVLRSLAWVDLTTPDLDGAAAFYSGLLGWDLQSVPTPMGRYVIGSVPAGPVGGMMAPPAGEEGRPPAWSLFFDVADAGEAFTEALRLGATGLQPPTEVPGGNVVAVVSDPAGAAVGFMESHGDDAVPWGVAGAVAWTETQSRDVAASAAFYEGLGWVQASGDDGYVVLEHDGRQVAGLMAMPEEVPPEVPSYWVAYFGVTDLDAACRLLHGLGGSLVVPVMTVQEMRFAFAEDPSGAAFALLETPG